MERGIFKSGSSYKQNEAVIDSTNNTWYFAKSNVNDASTAPSSDSTNWQRIGPNNIGDLGDVDTTTAPTNNQVLTYDSTDSMWKPEDASGGGSSTSTLLRSRSSINQLNVPSHGILYDSGLDMPILMDQDLIIITWLAVPGGFSGLLTIPADLWNNSVRSYAPNSSYTAGQGDIFAVGRNSWRVNFFKSNVSNDRSILVGVRTSSEKNAIHLSEKWTLFVDTRARP